MVTVNSKIVLNWPSLQCMKYLEVQNIFFLLQGNLCSENLVTFLTKPTKDLCIDYNMWQLHYEDWNIAFPVWN